jgi:chaperonin GroES
VIKFNEDSLSNRVIIKPFIMAKKSAGGIDLTALDDRKQAINTNQGEVFMIGREAWFDKPQKPDVKVGDKVYYSKYGGMVLKLDGMEDFLVLCNDEDILVGYSDNE